MHIMSTATTQCLRAAPCRIQCTLAGALLYRLICKWLSRDVGKPGCPDRCSGQMLPPLGLKGEEGKKEVNLITNRDLNPRMCAMCTCDRARWFMGFGAYAAFLATKNIPTCQIWCHAAFFGCCRLHAARPANASESQAFTLSLFFLLAFKHTSCTFRLINSKTGVSVTISADFSPTL